MLFALLAVANGLFAVVSRMVNAALAVAVGSLQGSFVNHLVGTLGAGVVVLVVWQGTDTFSLSGVPWIYFTGGCLGVGVVAASNYAVQHIGAARFALLLLAGQLFTSAAVDHFGLLSPDRVLMTPAKIGGLVLILAGALLVVTDRTERRRERTH